MTTDTDLPTATRSNLTLVLTTGLHAFTHAYSVLIVPLYLLVVADLKLPGVKQAAIVVTIYNVVYWGLAFVSGILADRFNRKVLLGIGLLGNGLAVLAMGLTRTYEWLIVWAIVAGIAGSLFHPAANAMVPAHYPKSPGMAIGLLGAGSGLGFFLGPQYAGWRAESATWHLWSVADWQRPLIELGLIGLVIGVIFLIFAREAPSRIFRRRGDSGLPVPSAEILASMPEPPSLPINKANTLGKRLRWQVVGLAFTLGFRDFAGVAGLSLASIFLQKAYGYGAKEAGLVVGCMMLLSVIVNPLAVYLSPGRRRLPALIAHLVLGACLVPLASQAGSIVGVVILLCLFQTCQLGSYAISDAATLERVVPEVRGRVVGLFLSIAGTIGATGPWIMGAWVDSMGAGAANPANYFAPYMFLSVCLVWAMLSVLIIRRIGHAPDPNKRGFEVVKERAASGALSPVLGREV
ncbi:MFS transporter [Humisphaera borealis]|uniref:MFS transporter n=1 Tax=Humisphaera borealis TaxID=2807512 RepID=A0A7M2WYL7_9BACT|nr:MFS transporter [Humisphaera borealis]QOV90555.1 MFS transporter [Humisphaera borealis]